MPTVLRSGSNRFFFWSNERAEPPHVHVESGDAYAKVWLDPVGLAERRAYTSTEIGRILRITIINRTELLERWREFFGSD